MIAEYDYNAGWRAALAVVRARCENAIYGTRMNPCPWKHGESMDAAVRVATLDLIRQIDELASHDR